MNAPEKELVAHIEDLFSAITAKDMDRIERCYLNEPVLLVFLEGPRSRNVGWDSIKVGWQHFLDASMELRGFEWGADLLVRGRGEAGFVAATNSYRWRVKGRDLTVRMRGTWVMERVNAEWRIVHEHGSFPHPDPYRTRD